MPGAAAVLLLAGCGAAEAPAAGDQEVLAAEQVFVADPVVVPDPSGTSATRRVTTELDMACAVVLGRDEGLGAGSPPMPTCAAGSTPTTRRS